MVSMVAAARGQTSPHQVSVGDDTDDTGVVDDHQGADPGLDEINKSDGLVSAVERLPVL